MLGQAFVKLCERPLLRKVLWRGWYGYLARMHRQEDWTFMNYGYRALDGAPLLPLAEADEPNRYCIQLYQRLATGVDLHGRQVAEVGSGRGGGAAFVHRHHRPARMVGVDLSASAVSFSRGRHRAAGLEFVTGDAERLPFPDAAFDAVFNIESSHCYPSVPKFLAEVRRVLKPGGVFLYTDFRDHLKLAAWHAEVRACGLGIEREGDITPGILAALDADSERKRAQITRLMHRPLRAAFAQFAGVRDTPIYNLFRDGKLIYWEYKLRKTA